MITNLFAGPTRLFPIAALALVLGACTVSDSGFGSRGAGEAQTFPASYRTDILSFMRTYLNDPSMVRDAAIAEPALRNIEGYERSAVCLRYNARDSSGRYGGVSDRLAVFFRGRFDRLMEKSVELCTGAAYSPFPELERLSR